MKHWLNLKYKYNNILNVYGTMILIVLKHLSGLFPLL